MARLCEDSRVSRVVVGVGGEGEVNGRVGGRVFFDLDLATGGDHFSGINYIEIDPQQD